MVQVTVDTNETSPLLPKAPQMDIFFFSLFQTKFSSCLSLDLNSIFRPGLHISKANFQVFFHHSLNHFFIHLKAPIIHLVS